jgi:hypothetical protein
MEGWTLEEEHSAVCGGTRTHQSMKEESSGEATASGVPDLRKSSL